MLLCIGLEFAALRGEGRLQHWEKESGCKLQHCEEREMLQHEEEERRGCNIGRQRRGEVAI